MTCHSPGTPSGVGIHPPRLGFSAASESSRPAGRSGRRCRIAATNAGNCWQTKDVVAANYRRLRVSAWQAARITGSTETQKLAYALLGGVERVRLPGCLGDGRAPEDCGTIRWRHPVRPPSTLHRALSRDADRRSGSKLLSEGRLRSGGGGWPRGLSVG